MNTAGKISLPLLVLLLAAILAMALPAAAWDDVPDDPEDDGDGVLESGESVWIEVDSCSSDCATEQEMEEFVNEEGAQEWVNDSPGGIDGEGTQFEVGQEYEVTYTYDWEGNVTGMTIEGVEEEEEPGIEIPESWDPPPQPAGWSCTPSDGENADRISDFGQVVSCPDSDNTWSAWSCDGPNQKKRTKTIRGCSGGSCYNSPGYPQVVNCIHGCQNGKCQPKADFTVSTTSSSETQKELSLNASPSEDPYSGSNLTYAWSFSDGTNDTGASVTKSIPADIPTQVTLIVTTAGLTGDIQAPDNGTTASKTSGGPEIQINAEPAPTSGSPAAVDAVGTTDDDDPSGTLLTYEWDYESDGTIDETFNPANSADPSAEPGTHVFTASGLTTIWLRVTDPGGLFSTATETIDVQNRPPEVDFTIIPRGGFAPLQVDCIDETTDPEGHALVAYEWVFEPGATASTQNADYTYTTSGTHTITLTVEDEYGAKGTLSKTINAAKISSISMLNATNPETVTEPAYILFACSDSTNIRLQYLDVKGEEIFPAETLSCGETPSTRMKSGFLESGAYQIAATIVDASGTPDPSCQNCPKTTFFIVGRDLPEIRGPETNLVLVAAIGLFVLIATRRKK